MKNYVSDKKLAGGGGPLKYMSLLMTSLRHDGVIKWWQNFNRWCQLSKYTHLKNLMSRYLVVQKLFKKTRAKVVKRTRKMSNEGLLITTKYLLTYCLNFSKILLYDVTVKCTLYRFYSLLTNSFQPTVFNNKLLNILTFFCQFWPNS